MCLYTLHKYLYTLHKDCVFMGNCCMVPEALVRTDTLIILLLLNFDVLVVAVLKKKI